MKQQSTQADAILNFYSGLKPAFSMPRGISIMNPFTDPQSRQLTTAFYRKFYSDHQQRTFIFGINPGRFGGGVTGVPFTDPLRLEAECGIANPFKKLPELSSQFIYAMIGRYGGVELFYRHFFITALSPLGFVKDGKNLNYYDDKILLKSCEPFMMECIRRQLETISAGRIAFCLGEGQNFSYFQKLNDRHQFFDKIIPLPHPRWVMQYRRKKMDEYEKLYVEKLASCEA